MEILAGSEGGFCKKMSALQNLWAMTMDVWRDGILQVDMRQWLIAAGILAGLVLAWSYEHTGTLAVPLGVHVLANLVAL